MSATIRKYIRNVLLKEGLKFDSLKGCSLLVDETYHDAYYMLVSPDFGQTLEILAEEYDWTDNIWMDTIDFVKSREGKKLLQDVYGMVHISKGSVNPYKCWEVKKAAAKSGWGPTIYDIVMGLSPNGLMADRDSVSPDAFRVYSFYLNDRDDIEKNPIDTSGWTETKLDDGRLGGNGEWTLLNTHHSTIDALSMDETLEDPLTWVYNRERVPQTDQLVDNGIKEVRDYVVPWPMTSDHEFTHFVRLLAKLFFNWMY
jgi:hypothetical protein